MKGSGLWPQLHRLQTHNSVTQPGRRSSPSGAPVPNVSGPICVCVHVCMRVRACVCVCVCAFMQAGTGTKLGAVQQLRGRASRSLANSDPHSQPGLKRVWQTQSDPQTGQITKLKGATTEGRGCHISIFACLPWEQQVLNAWESTWDREA